MPDTFTTLAAPKQRYTALDGLRGLAALIVVIAHTYFFLQPVIADAVEKIIYGSYLSVFISGREAVAIFFVLSGFVITLPVLNRGKRFRWGNYYISRFLRLYLPTAASLLLSAGLILLVPRVLPLVMQNTWLGSSTTTLTFPEMLVQLLFFPAYSSFPTNNVLWSLRWEMYFSLLLPVFVAVAVVVKKFWWILVVLCLAMLWYGLQDTTQTETAAQFFATFAFGTLIAVHRAGLQRVVDRIKKNRPRAIILGILLPVASVTCLIAYHLVPVPTTPAPLSAFVLAEVLYPLGAVGFVLSALYVLPATRFLQTRVMQFLGRISFSLYLVHVPVIVTFGYLFGLRNLYLAALCGVVASFLIAILFQKFIEAPSHTFAKFAGRALPTKLKAMYVDIRTNGITVRKPPPST